MLFHVLRRIAETPSQRSNLANARLKGLQEDLNLNDTQYATSLSILFAGYIFVRLTPANTYFPAGADPGVQMQVPSNLIMNTVPTPRLYLAFVTVTWGLVSALTAVRSDPTVPR
jgi:hypothetical protein